jgi:MFS superfamily sulfate permease-like transporter
VRIGLRAGLIFAPLCGAIGLFATLDPIVGVVATLGGGLGAGTFFGVAAHFGSEDEPRR